MSNNRYSIDFDMLVLLHEYKKLYRREYMWLVQVEGILVAWSKILRIFNDIVSEEEEERKNKINHPENPHELKVEKFVQLVLSKLYIKYNDEEDSMDHLMDHRYTRQLLVQSDHPPLEKTKQWSFLLDIAILTIIPNMNSILKISITTTFGNHA